MSSREFGAELPPLSLPGGRLSSLVTPEEGQPQPRPCRTWRCKAAVEKRLCCRPGLSAPAPSLITSSRPPCLHNKEEGQITRCWACNPTLQPLFSPNMKKGLIVFNNMLSILTPPVSITSTLPSLIRIRITSGAMFCPSLLLNLITTGSRGRDTLGF